MIFYIINFWIIKIDIMVILQRVQQHYYYWLNYVWT